MRAFEAGARREQSQKQERERDPEVRSGSRVSGEESSNMYSIFSFSVIFVLLYDWKICLIADESIVM